MDNGRKFGITAKMTSAPFSDAQFINISPQSVHQFEINPLSKQRFLLPQNRQEQAVDFY